MHKLKGVIARLEQTLPSELRKLSVHERIDRAWRSAFTSLNLNQANPPVWMRILPQRLSYGGYEIADDRLLLRLGMTARTETFVGPRPPDPPATPLPALSRLDQRLGLVHFAVPVIADYHEIEPVLMRALVKRSARPFEVPGLGPVNARFGSVEIYGTDGGKVAVGVTFAASLPGGKPSHGTVWLTAIPVSHENSRKVAFTDLSVAGITDSTGSRLLLKLANAPVLADTIAASLTQNFGRDYDDLLGKIGRALADKRIGDLNCAPTSTTFKRASCKRPAKAPTFRSPAKAWHRSRSTSETRNAVFEQNAAGPHPARLVQKRTGIRCGGIIFERLFCCY